MAFLRCDIQKLTLLTNFKKPSPTCVRQASFSESARNPKKFHLRRAKVSSLFAPLFESRKAGMTVEASIVLPLFLFFFMNIASFLEMIRLHGNLELALWNTGSQLAVYGYALDSGELPKEEQEDGWWRKLSGAAFSSVFVKSQLVSQLGKQYLDESPLRSGTDSLMLWESDVFGTGDTIDLIVTYSVSPWNRLPDLFPFRLVNRCYVHIWNGYEIPGQEQTGEMVYIAETGQVYHPDRNCTHLRLSVREIRAGELGGARNDYGRKYTACEKCANGRMPEMLYITGEGDRYHYRRDCPGLKRTVSAMLKADAEKSYRPCSRCGTGTKQ